ncbi:DUF2510 domain-containing protein [Microbacterium sp. KUDC0406]|uniref:DUF2510 domain-containing protein n=1 Tax=Microbacterium sp. KUDC0406 TaxID=2909588 RepID=UPI001F3784A9|nr:DUF2510 domain-containing protein [Microbacterium sp. KUDC0406]UJP08907.1 DUF2510 domain-containing protein [Microbacterium sp. KUDC0406]
MTSAPAGWYPDPSRPEQHRWWDGAAWTEYVQPVAGPGLLPPPATPAAAKTRRRRLPVWAWVLIGIAVVVLGILLSPVFAPLWLVVLITGIVALAKNTRTWLRFRSRRTATVVTVVSAVGFLITGSLSSVVLGQPSDAPVVAATPVATLSPTADATPDVAEEDADAVAFAGRHPRRRTAPRRPGAPRWRCWSRCR